MAYWLSGCRKLELEKMHWNCFGHTLKVEPHPLKVNKSRSSLNGMKYEYGVPQSSVLGPTLFNMYSIPLGDIMQKYVFSYHMYANDGQMYIDFSSYDEETAMANLQLCVQDIKTW